MSFLFVLKVLHEMGIYGGVRMLNDEATSSTKLHRCRPVVSGPEVEAGRRIGDDGTPRAERLRDFYDAS